MTKGEIESGRVDIRLLRVGSPCHAPTYPALYKTSTEKHEKKHQRNIWKCQQTILPIRDIFEIVNRQSYPALFKTSTEKHEKNIREIFKIVNRQSRYHLRFWFSVFLTKAMSVLSVSHFTFSGTFYLWKFAKLTNRPERPLLLIYLVHFHQDEILLTRSRFLPTNSGTEKHANLTNILVLAFSDWCYGSPSNTIQRIFSPGGYPGIPPSLFPLPFLPEVAKPWVPPYHLCRKSGSKIFKAIGTPLGDANILVKNFDCCFILRFIHPCIF